MDLERRKLLFNALKLGGAVACASMGFSPMDIAWASNVQKAKKKESGGTSYLVNQNFEGEGYDNGETWVETGTPDPDSTGIVLRGTQSLQLDFNDSTRSPQFTAQSTLWAFFRVQFDAITGNTHFFQILNSSQTVIAYVQTRAAPTIRAYQGTTYAEGGTPADDTTYFMWIKYVKSAPSAGDGVLDFYMGTSTTRPGSPTISISTGDAEDDSSYIHLRHINVTATSVIFDQVLASASEIGNVDA